MKVALVYMDRALNTSGLSQRHVTSDPLGIRYLAGHAHNAGHDVKVYLQGSRSLEEMTEYITADNLDLVGFSCLTYNLPISQEIAKRLKKHKKNPKIVFGGEHPSLSPETTFTSDVDAVIKGEGEITFAELLTALEENISLDSVPGLYLPFSGGPRFTSPRKQTEIDSLAWPLRDEQIIKSTRMNSFMYPSPYKQTGLITLLGSRGCSFSCIYCSSHELWGNRTRFRNVTDVSDEIEDVYRKTSANVGVFYDLTFNVNSEWVNRLCDELINRKINEKMSFYSTCRVSAPNGRLILTKDVLQKMKKAGFSKIGIGIESTDDIIAGEYKNGKSPWDNTLEVVNFAHVIGMLVRGFLMIGGPKETPKTYEEAKKRLNSIPLHDLRVGYLTPLPGTSLDSQYPIEKRYTNDLARYDCSNPIIQSPCFTYEQLVGMERDLLKHFHNSNYRSSVISNIVKREQRLEDSAKWRIEDLKKKGLI